MRVHLFALSRCFHSALRKKLLLLRSADIVFSATMSSSYKTNSVGRKKASFLIEDILKTKSPSAAIQYDSLCEDTVNTSAMLYTDLHPVHGRLFTAAAALLGNSRAPAVQNPAQLMASSTAALQRHLQAAAFYATTAASHQTSSTSFDRSVSGHATADVSTAFLFPNNDCLQGELLNRYDIVINKFHDAFRSNFADIKFQNKRLLTDDEPLTSMITDLSDDINFDRSK